MAETEGDPFGLVGSRLENKYEVSEVVAEGGFGVVYRALHLGLQKTVALKVLKTPPGLDGPTQVAYLEKFAQEARLIAALEHPAIVRVIDFGVSPLDHGMATPWMALEWLEGTTLEAHLEERGGEGEAPTAVFATMERVLDAIAFAHDEGIVHRDLKPANLMLVANRRGELGIKVLDFGIAKTVSAEEAAGGSGATKTRSDLVAFSPHYAAPEQLTAMRTGPATDVHALGLILVEMLCGQGAYRGADLSEIYAAALSPTRPTPALHGIDVGDWEPVLARALAFKPAERFANARDFLEALRSALPGARHLAMGPRGSREPAVSDEAATLRGASIVASPRARPSRRGLAALAVCLVAGLILVAETGLRRSPAPLPATPTRPVAVPATPIVPEPAVPTVPETVAPPVALEPPVAPVDAGMRAPAVPPVRRAEAMPTGRRRVTRRPASTATGGGETTGSAEIPLE